MPEGPTTPRRHALILVLLTGFGLIGLGRLAEAAWMHRPIPSELPEIGARTDEAQPFLLVIIDGLHERAFKDPGAMPWLQRFALRGVSGIALTGEPTLTAPCVRAIVSGRRPDVISGFQNFTAPAIQGNLIQYLVDRGGIPAHAGDAAVFQICRPAFEGARVFQVPDQGPTDQGQTDARAVPFALDAIDAGCNVVSLHLTKVDHAGHKYGAAGSEYWNACTVVDGQIRQVTQRFLALHPQATVLIASDHGVSVRGTHGGGELSARRAPFVLVGPAIARTAGVEIDQSALAPTVAMALGLPQPPLADAPPVPELTTLSEDDKNAALDAYVTARAFVAEYVSGDGADFISRRRAELTTRAFVPAGEWLALAEKVNALVNPSAAGLALFTLLLSWIFVACVLHLARGPPVRAASAWPLGIGLVLGALLVLDLFSEVYSMTALHAGFFVLFGCGAVMAARSERRVPPYLIAGACLAAVPVLTGAGQTFQSAFTHPDTAVGAGQRIWLVLAAAVFLVGFLVRPTALWTRLRERFRNDEIALLAIAGAAIGFGVTLRPFVDNIVHTMVLYAIAAGLVALGIANTPGARAVPKARLGFLAVAVLVFAGSRIAEGVLGAAWIEFTPMRGGFWLALGALATTVALAVVTPGAWRRADRAALGLACAALVGAFAFRIVGADALESGLGRPWLVTFSLGLNVLAIAALVLTSARGSPDGRLLVQILAALALARRLSVLDAEYAVFAVVAIGAVCASRFQTTSSRFGLAKLAIGLILLRTGVFHAMGFVESFSTLDVGQAFAGLGTADDPNAMAARGTQVTWQVQVAGIQVALRMALPWILFLAAVMRAAPGHGAAAVRTLTADLSVGFAARGAAIIAAVWVWWKSRWWMDLAHTVFLYTICDLVLLTAMALLLGAWRGREPVRSPEVFA